METPWGGRRLQGQQQPWREGGLGLSMSVISLSVVPAFSMLGGMKFHLGSGTVGRGPCVVAWGRMERGQW